MYSVSPNNSTTSLSDDDVDDVDVQDMPVSFHYPKDVHPAKWSSSLTRCGSVGQPSPTSPMRRSTNLAALLPPEILIHVLRHLHSTRDLYHALLVSRTWCSCAVELLWHRPSFQEFPHFNRMLDVITSEKPTTFDYASFLRRLNFAFIASEVTDALFTPLSVCTRLERLTLLGCADLTDKALLEVLPHMHNMVALDLSNIPHLSDAPVVAIAKAAPKLQGINLSGCKDITDVAVSAIAENCPLIRRVKLFNVKLITDESIMALARGCPVLLELDLIGCPKITDFSTRDLWTYCPALRELRIAQCIELTDLGFPALPPAVPDPINTLVLTQPNGRQIEVQPFPAAHPTVPADIVPPLRLNRIAEHLRILDLTGCYLLTDDAVAGIVYTAPKLRNLVLAKCPQLTDVGIEHICKLGKHLHYLHLGHASSITDRSVRLIAQSCTRLRYIDLACCPLLTDMSVSELSVLPKLRRIGLVRVTNLTDNAIYALASRHASLERIHLSYCEHISVQAIHCLLQSLVRLTHLSLTGVPAFRQPSLQKFCRSPPGEFNTTQRAAFCVYSGKGVNELRRFLAEQYKALLQAAGADDTDYDMDEDDDGRPPRNRLTTAELYVELQRERDKARRRLRQERDLRNVRHLNDQIGNATGDEWHSERPSNGHITRFENTRTVIAPEEVFEDEARTPLSRFSSSLLASLPRGNIPMRRANDVDRAEAVQQPEAGPSNGRFVQETKASSLATTPSPTEHQAGSRYPGNAVPSEDSPPRNFADSPLVESTAPTPAIERFQNAFFQYPAYVAGLYHEDTRPNGDGGRLNGSLTNSSMNATAPLRTFTPPEHLGSDSSNGRGNVYTPDVVLENLGNRRPPINRSLSDNRYAEGTPRSGSSSRAFNGHRIHHEADTDTAVQNNSLSSDYPFRLHNNQRPPDDLSLAWPPQSLVDAHGPRERQRMKDGSSRSKRRHHNSSSPIPFQTSLPMAKELQESVHSALANGSGTSYAAAAGSSKDSELSASSRPAPGGAALAESSGTALEAGSAAGADSSRGRSARRGWKGTFTAAENYASALFFGRGVASGSGNVSSASSSSGREGGRAS